MTHAQNLTAAQRWNLFMDWVTDSFVPWLCLLTGISFIFFSYYGINLYWMADAFQWGGIAMILLGLKWASDVRFRQVEARIEKLERRRF